MKFALTVLAFLSILVSAQAQKYSSGTNPSIDKDYPLLNCYGSSIADFEFIESSSNDTTYAFHDDHWKYVVYRNVVWMMQYNMHVSGALEWFRNKYGAENLYTESEGFATYTWYGEKVKILLNCFVEMNCKNGALIVVQSQLYGPRKE